LTTERILRAGEGWGVLVFVVLPCRHRVEVLAEWIAADGSVRDRLGCPADERGERRDARARGLARLQGSPCRRGRRHMTPITPFRKRVLPDDLRAARTHVPGAGGRKPSAIAFGSP